MHCNFNFIFPTFKSKEKISLKTEFIEFFVNHVSKEKNIYNYFAIIKKS